MRFIGRENELEALIRRYDDSKSELSIVYGSRRIGKSELLMHIEKWAKGIHIIHRKINKNTSFIWK